jgi:hypothetical protein
LKLFLDILRLKVMMTGMSMSQMTKSTGSSMAATGTCLRGFAGLRLDMEVAMKKVLIGLMAVAIVAAVVAGGALASARTSADMGMMPEVVSTAEMPRLVMATVEVHAYQAVAMSVSDYNAN